MPKAIKPPKDIKVGKQYQYLNIPKDMEDCFYELELVEFRETDQNDKLVAVFDVLDTDTKVKVGSQVSNLLDPYQKFAETYFWREIFAMYTVLKGRELTQERIDKLMKNHEMPLEKLKEGELNGQKARIDFRRYEKDGKPKTASTWTPLQDSE